MRIQMKKSIVLPVLLSPALALASAQGGVRQWLQYFYDLLILGAGVILVIIVVSSLWAIYKAISSLLNWSKNTAAQANQGTQGGDDKKAALIQLFGGFLGLMMFAIFAAIGADMMLGDENSVNIPTVNIGD